MIYIKYQHLFCKKKWKISQTLLSVAVLIGPLEVEHFPFYFFRHIILLIMFNGGFVCTFFVTLFIITIKKTVRNTFVFTLFQFV